ncbi:MAG: zinc ribbon domain-containing protein [Myxococcota bacterium]|nr:zinc ribbon domain-containing protein [Myxococcota bacterium]
MTSQLKPCSRLSPILALVLILLGSGVAFAQIPQHVTAPEGSVGPPEPRPGSIQVRVLPAQPGDAVGGLPIVLYALQADGRPGLVSGDTDASGEFLFTNLNNSPDVTYLVGTRYREIPFGQRAGFVQGETEAQIEIQLQPIKSEASELEVAQVLWLVDWVGSRLLIQVAQQINNLSDHVLYIQEENRETTPPLFEVPLPSDMTDFLGASENLSRGDGAESDRLFSFGPFYPGEQELRYGFLVESQNEDGRVEVEQRLPQGAARAAILLPPGMEPPEGADWRDTGETLAVGEENYRRFEVPSVEPGGTQPLAFQPPPSSGDASALRLTRADYWVDHDDTEVRVNADVQFHVGGALQLVGSDEDPLLHIDLPEGAEFQGLTAGSSAFGVVPGKDGGLDVKGPLPPGPSSLGYRYRLPAGEETRLDLQVSKEVEMLNVLVADNGVVIDSERLHRQRPFKQGTRFYLHRQAYRVDPGEKIELALTPIGSSGLSQNAARVAALLAGVLAAAFLVAPLRTRRKEPLADETAIALSRERENVYESMSDLENDLETGKIDEDDYRLLRAELHATAVEMLRREENLELTAAGEDDDAGVAVQTTCSECNGNLQTGWKFCSHCGAPVP